jgi:hypothetical protein
VADGRSRRWSPVDDQSLRDTFVRAYSDKLGRLVPSEDLRIEQADDAVRISYRGGEIQMIDPDGGPLDLLECVTEAARTLAQNERDNEYH